MPKVKLSSVTATKLRTTDGVFAVHGRDAAGREVEVELPLSAIRRLAAETRRASLVTPRRSSLPANAGLPGDWSEVVPLDVRTAAVGALTPPAGPAVGIVFDQGEDTELTFRLPAKGARDLGQMLLAEGEKLSR
jgi:hypothetical protein